MTDIITWIEGHPETIGIIKWAALLIVAWIGGVFRFFGKFFSKSKLEIIETASMCFIEDLDEFQEKPNCVRTAYLIDISVKNPSTEKIVVESFSLSYVTQKIFKANSKFLIKTTLPSRPRIEMGSGTKNCKVFFTDFNDVLQA